MRPLGPLFSVLVLTAACGESTRESTPPPARTAKDATVNLDAGVVHFDAQSAADVGFEDATSPSPDAGQVADAGNPAADSGATSSDAGQIADAGHIADASTTFPDASMPPVDAGPADPGPAVLNPNWIGGPCTNDADCPFAGGRCLTATDGYPGGMCTQTCTRFCPDQSGPLNSVTFCVDDRDGDGDGLCMSRCDATLSPTGCRAGYACIPEKRTSQPDFIRYSCVPRTGLPNRAPPPYDIGGACINDADCGRNTCLGLPGGYCTQEACNVVGCPSGSTCYRLGLEDYHVCLDNCASTNDCRSNEGYSCDSDQTCYWYPPPRPMCDHSDAARRCSQYASQVSNDFVVVVKHKRSLTQCQGSRVVNSYCVGLGSVPVGDKEREGDRKTPEGVFYIPRVLPNSQFYKAFLLSYPDTADAARGLSSGLITQSEHDAIVSAQNRGTEPPQFTNLGGLIEIHGRGSSSDWTWGCIAVEDSVIDALWGTLGVGDHIVVER